MKRNSSRLPSCCKLRSCRSDGLALGTHLTAKIGGRKRDRAALEQGASVLYVRVRIPSSPLLQTPPHVVAGVFLFPGAFGQLHRVRRTGGTHPEGPPQSPVHRLLLPLRTAFAPTCCAA